MLTRRNLTALAAAAVVAPAVAHAPVASAKTAKGGVADPLRDLIVINSLGGLEDPNKANLDADAPLSKRVIDDAVASGLTAMNITLGYVSGDAEPFETSVRGVVSADKMVREHSDRLTKALTAADIRRAKADGKIALIYGFQNAAQMGTQVDRVDLFADLGVRVVQLTYNPQNQLGGGSMAAATLPLTPFGREVVERLNARRVIVDLSHSGQQTCLDTARASKAPICISHTGCRALNDVPRNKTDEELRLVADKGGYVGIYFMPFLADRQITGDDVCAHIEHAIKVCGEDAVGVGTDGGTTGIDDMEGWKKAFADQILHRRAMGVSAPGEQPDRFTFAPDMYGPDQFRILARKLAQRGHPPRRIEKVLGGNFLQYAADVWGG
ncbi:dipeptidase [Caulobacter soli]|uniref:dipeptidase n=1 Tax=Caulobacter soli TaxID=2708539 RepID=UPI0013EC5D05|nr:membrane dipeptidase [Caulobacter soli]